MAWPLLAAAAEGFLEVHVEPAVVDVPEPALKGQRHWKILPTPPPTVIADEPFRTRLQAEVDAAFRQDHPWIADLKSEWSLVARLAETLRAAALQFTRAARVDDRATGRPLVYFTPPRQSDGPAHVFIPFTYTLTEMTKLRIEVSSATDGTSTTTPAVRDLPLPADWRDLLPAENRDTVADRIGVQLRGRDAQLTQVESERLLKVARHAFTVAAGQNALPPRPVVDETIRERIVLILRATIIPQPQPLRSAITFGPDPAEPGLWILAVRGISPIADVRIEGRYDLPALLAPGTSVDDRTQARLTAKAAEVSADLDKRFAADFAALRGTVLVRDDLDALIGRLRTEAPDRIAAVEDPRLDGGVLILPVVIRPTVKTLVGSLGLGYTPREGVTGTAGITGQNLLGWNDTISFDLKGGPDNRRADFDFGVPLPSRWWNDERLAARVSLHGLYSRAIDTVLGQPRNATVDEEENAVRLRQSLIFQPFARRGPEVPGADTRVPSSALGLSESTALGLDVEIGRRDVDLSGVVAPPGTPLDGVAAPMLVTFRASTGFEPRDKTDARLRLVDLRLESTYERSFSIFGSDLTYERWDLRASIEGVFWWFSRTPRNDALLRFVYGYGTANDGTPLFRFLRVGGESNVRGVEEGEFIGRRLQYQQLEAGVSLCALQHLVFPRKDVPAGGGAAAAKPAPAERECQLGGFDLGHAFVKVFLDHADVAERAVGGRLEPGTKSIFGGGVALELHGLPVGNQRLSLTIGYAYSPDSERHRSGTAFTQVVMPFSLRR